MQKIVLDTNFLLIPGQFKIDVFSEIDRICIFKYRIYVLDKTVKELKKIVREQRGKSKEAANLALQLLKRKDLKILRTKSEKGVDELLLGLKGYIIATQDAELKRKLRKKGAKLIIMAGKKHLRMI